MKVDDGDKETKTKGTYYITSARRHSTIYCDSYGSTDPYTVGYTALKTKCESIFAPSVLEVTENFKFNSCKQELGEDVLSYANVLTKMSTTCNFGQFQQTALRNQFVFGLVSQAIQSRLLDKNELTFDTVLQTATSMELTSRETQALKNGTASLHYLHAQGSKGKKTRKNFRFSSSSSTSTSNGRSGSGSRLASKSCYRCGGGHSAKDCKLPNYTVCNFCS